MVTIVQIASKEDCAAVKALVLEFVAWAAMQDPDADSAPTFANLEAELAALPGIYGPPTGAFLLARDGDTPAGCVAFREVDAETVELPWLPPVVQEFSDLCACDRLRSSFRPRCAAFPEAAGRHGDQRIRSKSWGRTLGSKFDYGFPDPDLFDRCAHSGHSSLTLPLAPTLVITT